MHRMAVSHSCFLKTGDIDGIIKGKMLNSTPSQGQVEGDGAFVS
jgi:hypothetical protein